MKRFVEVNSILHTHKHTEDGIEEKYYTTLTSIIPEEVYFVDQISDGMFAYEKGCRTRITLRSETQIHTTESYDQVMEKLEAAMKSEESYN